MATFRDDLPNVVYMLCPRCGIPVPVNLRWTVTVEQRSHDDSLFFETQVVTTSSNCDCPNYVSRTARP